jgi:hypothetical protein
MNVTDLPTCGSDPVQGQCFDDWGSKGGVVYSNFEPCSTTPILLPGFALLPTWLLAGAPPSIAAPPRSACARCRPFLRSCSGPMCTHNTDMQIARKHMCE